MIQRPGYCKDFEDYALDKSTAVTGDSLDQKVVWETQSDLESLKGKYIRLKIAGPNLMASSASFEAYGMTFRLAVGTTRFFSGAIEMPIQRRRE